MEFFLGVARLVAAPLIVMASVPHPEPLAIIPQLNRKILPFLYFCFFYQLNKCKCCSVVVYLYLDIVGIFIYLVREHFSTSYD